MADELPDLSSDNPLKSLLDPGATPKLSTGNPLLGYLEPERAQHEVVVPNYLASRLKSEATWKDVAPEVKEKFGVDPEQFRQDYQLNEARAVQSKEGISTKEAFVRTSAPFISAAVREQQAKEYTNAMGRYREGKATGEDAGVIARYERLQQIDQQVGSTFAGKAVQAVGAAPALIGESIGAGKLLGAAGRGLGLASAGRVAGQVAATPLMPSLYVDRAIAKNLEEGRSADDWRGFPSAVSYAAAQNVLLGRLRGKTGDLPAAAIAGHLRAGAGLAGEQALLDVAAGAVDRVLPKAWRTDTKFGILGQVADGKYGEAMQNAAVQTMTFAAFSAMHSEYKTPEPRTPESLPGGDQGAQGATRSGEGLSPAGGGLPPGPEPAKKPDHSGPIWDSFNGAVKWMQGNRINPDAIAAEFQGIHDKINAAWEKNPDLTQAEAGALFAGMRPSPLKKYAQSLVDSGVFLKKAPPAAPATPKPPPRTAETVNEGVKLNEEPPVSPQEAQGAAQPEPAQVPAEVVDRRGTGRPGSGDRRNPAARAEYDALSPEEKYQRIYQSPMVDLPNRRAYDAAEKTAASPIVGMSDADGLKALNDKFGYEAGNALLRAKAEALKAAGVDAYHEKGDEFLQRSHDEVSLKAGMEKARHILRNSIIEVDMADGSVRRFKGADFSYGVGHDLTAAETGLKAHKSEREARGERARGELRGITEVGQEPSQAGPGGTGGLSGGQAEGPRSLPMRGRDRLLMRMRGQQAARGAQPAPPTAAPVRPTLPPRPPGWNTKLFPTQQALRSFLYQGGARRAANAAVANRPEIPPPQARPLGIIPRYGREQQLDAVWKNRVPQARQHVGRALADPTTENMEAARGAVESVRRIAEARGMDPDKAVAAELPKWAAKVDRLEKEQAAKAKKASLDQQRKKNLFKAETLLGRIKKEGGIDPESAKALGIDPANEKEFVQSMFKDANGRKGRRSIEDIIPELIRSGDLPVESPDMHHHDLLMEKLRTGALTADQPEVHFEKQYEKWVKQQMAEQAAQEVDRAKEDLRRFDGKSEPEIKAILDALAEEVAREDREEAQAIATEPHTTSELAADFEIDPAGEFQFKRHGAEPTGRAGAVTIPNFHDTNLARGIEAVVQEWSKLRGQQFPATTKASEPVADKMAALISAKAYAQAATEMVMQAVFGNLKKEVRAKFYTAHLEMRLAFMRSKGANATSLIGPDSPIKTFAEYQRITSSPAFQRYLDRWKKVEVPIMDKHYRDSQGLAPNAPIPTTTQLPGYPINLVRVRVDGSTTAIGSGGQRMRPENVTQRKFGFARKATGESPFGYETDPEKALLSAHEQGAASAARANLDRTAVAEGQAEWGRPGQPQPTMMGGDRMVPVRHVDPQPGTQVAMRQQGTLFVNPKIINDYHNAIDLGQDFRVPGLTPALQAVTRIAVASTVEFAYHSMSLLASVAKPGVLRNTVREFWDYMKPVLRIALLKKPGMPHLTDAQLERYAGLAEIGATKEKGFQAGNLVPEWLAEKYPITKTLDPTQWGAHFLDVIDKVQRLAMERSFAKAAAPFSGPFAGFKKWLVGSDRLAIDSKANLRDFINTIGQYKKQAQAIIVRILRGTGIGPFATAATNSPVQAVRSLWASSGMTATTPRAQAYLRAQVMLKLAAAVGLTQLMNWLLWGRPDGDDSTPWGAAKVYEQDGRTYYVDPLRMMGPRRGLHVTGGEALIEGNRVGASNRAIGHKAVGDVTSAFMHPVTGPGVTMAYTQYTGKNTLGMNLAGRPETPDGTVEWENFKAAVKNVNPTLAALMGADTVKEGQSMPFFPLFGKSDGRTENEGIVGDYPEDRPFGAAASKLAAPYVGSRKQLGAAQLRGLMEKEALPKRLIPYGR